MGHSTSQRTGQLQTGKEAKPLPSGKRNPCHQETEAGKCQFHSVSVQAQQTHARAFIDFFFFSVFKERKENEN